MLGALVDIRRSVFARLVQQRERCGYKLRQGPEHSTHLWRTISLGIDAGAAIVTEDMQLC